MQINLGDYCTVGIDVCKGKWIAVCLKNNEFEIGKFDTIKEVCENYENADYIIVDMPIGLLDDSTKHRPESEARKYLKGKTSSIFNTPCRKAVYSDDYESAAKANKEILGVGLAIQSYAISSKIREVDEFLNNNPEWKNRLLEGHPEICFAKLNDDKAVLENKTKEEGQKKRLDILKKYYKDSEKVVERFLKEVPARKKIDDVIDALCLAITGALSMEYGMKSIPETPDKDANGLKMQMVYSDMRERCTNMNNIITYNKLVRDKIPEIIKKDNKECEIETASNEEKLELLKTKLNEEVNEFLEDNNIEELADVMEVLFGLVDSLGYSEEDLIKTRDKKKKERGGFKEGIILKKVIEK